MVRAPDGRGRGYCPGLTQNDRPRTTRCRRGQQRRDGTNPEELIAAAHAGCFSMALSGELGRAGHSAESVETTATVHLDKQEEGFGITRIVLETRARVPGISEDEFQQAADGAKTGCPVSRALAAVDSIELRASLVE